MSATKVAATNEANQESVASALAATPAAIVPLKLSHLPDDDRLKLLARALGRQAARQHLARGLSIGEVVIALGIAVLLLAALLLACASHVGSQ